MEILGIEHDWLVIGKKLEVVVEHTLTEFSLMRGVNQSAELFCLSPLESDQFSVGF